MKKYKVFYEIEINKIKNEYNILKENIINKNLCIVKYMLGQHAIFYPNKEIAKQFYSNTIHHLFENETSTANDELWAKKQAEYKTYALMCPSFYQKCNRNEPYTNFKIN